MDKIFWQNKRVFVTGHTGFKGSWLSLWLQHMGAKVKGYALTPPTEPNLFQVANVTEGMTSEIGDVRDDKQLLKSISTFKPEIVFHLAAQPLVRLSYSEPVETYSTNVMGTVYLLEAVRQVGGVKAVVNITSDKCYDNKEWVWGYREHEAMGGYDPYSNSKGCAELVTASYRDSFFNPAKYAQHGTAVATVRAGNVIGGGDWALDRIVPDILRAFTASKSVVIRNPTAIRPWQHVLDPLSGYLLLAEKLYDAEGKYAESWNLGPIELDVRPVSWIADRLTQLWGAGAHWELDNDMQPHEAHYLKLDCSKAHNRLGWLPRWSLEKAIEHIVSWHHAYDRGEDMRQRTLQDIEDYTHSNYVQIVGSSSKGRV